MQDELNFYNPGNKIATSLLHEGEAILKEAGIAGN